MHPDKSGRLKIAEKLGKSGDCAAHFMLSEAADRDVKRIGAVPESPLTPNDADLITEGICLEHVGGNLAGVCGTEHWYAVINYYRA